MGGHGGDINIYSAGNGGIGFYDTDLVSGSGYNYLVAKPFMQDLNDIASFTCPLGGLGGRGSPGFTSSGGDGANGGIAGAISIIGQTNLQGTAITQEFYGWNGENPNYVYPSTEGTYSLGEMQIYLDSNLYIVTLFMTCSTLQ